MPLIQTVYDYLYGKGQVIGVAFTGRMAVTFLDGRLALIEARGAELT